MLKCGCIYVLRNEINGKVYVGKTIRNTGERLREHRSRLRKGNTRPAYQAMIVDGVTDITLEVIEENIPENQLREREVFHMERLDSIRSGYNHLKGNRMDLPTKEIADLYQYGFILQEIAGMYGVSRDAIKNCISERVKICEWNDEQRIKGLTKEVLVELYEKRNHTTSEIAAMFNTSSTTVGKHIKKHGIPLRPAVNRKYL